MANIVISDLQPVVLGLVDLPKKEQKSLYGGLIGITTDPFHKPYRHERL